MAVTPLTRTLISGPGTFTALHICRWANNYVFDELESFLVYVSETGGVCHIWSQRVDDFNIQSWICFCFCFFYKIKPQLTLGQDFEFLFTCLPQTHMMKMKTVVCPQTEDRVLINTLTRM